MAEEMSKNYAAYMDVKMKGEMRVVHDTIEDMLTRLDEFENLVSLIHNNEVICVDETMPSLLASRTRLDDLCGRIDKLEEFINRVDFDLSVVEGAVEKASHDLEAQNSGRLRTLFKPFFFKNERVEKPSRQTPICDVSEIFSTEDFFPVARPKQPSET